MGYELKRNFSYKTNFSVKNSYYLLDSCIDHLPLPVETEKSSNLDDIFTRNIEFKTSLDKNVKPYKLYFTIHEALSTNYPKSHMYPFYLIAEDKRFCSNTYST
jgi:hypothetical protein